MPQEKRRVLAALLLVLPMMVPASAVAQQPEGLGLQITPASTEFDLNQRTFRAVATITNLEPGPRRVFLRVTGLGHDLDGSPLLIEPSIISRSTELSVERFTLQPEQSRRVELTGEIPDGHRGVYAALVARYEEPGAEEAEGETRVNVETQVAASYLLRGPRPWVQTVEVVDVSILPGPPRGPFAVFAAVRNTGNVHVKPSGRVEIFKDGESLGTVLLAGRTIVPGFARRLTGTWNPKERLSGQYTLEATIQDPEAAGVGQVDFTAGTIRRVTGDIVGMVAQDGKVTVSYRNTGTVPIEPEVRLAATKEDVEQASQSVAGDQVAPGDLGSVSWTPNADPGLYVVTAQLLADGEALDQEVTGLEVPSPDIRPLIIGGALVLLLALLLVFVLRRRRRHPRQERKLRRKEAPVAEPAPRDVSVSSTGPELAAVDAARAAAEAALQAAQAAQDAAAALSGQAPQQADLPGDAPQEDSGESGKE